MSSAAVTVGRHGLRLLPEGDVPLLGGEMHYFRLNRDHWGRCLDAFVDLGLPCVQTYVPWVVHECEPGRFDFSEGPLSALGYERDLGGFLDACAERGLKVLLRPGPHINAEMTDFGFPERVLRDEHCLARGSRGNHVILPVLPRAFPIPSYASEVFLAEASHWLEGFGAFVAPRCHPDGPVVAIQVDNEHGFFRTAAYDQDYHPDAIAQYRRFLIDKYPDNDAVRRADPPHSFDAQRACDIPRHLDWLRFKEWMVTQALSRLADVLRRSGVQGVPLYHNFIAQSWGAPCGISAAEQVLDLAGTDVYLGRSDYMATRSAARTLAGASRLPFVPELGCGVWPWWWHYSQDDQEAATLALLMHGVKGFNLYMLVERDRWYGSPIGPDGTKRQPHYDRVRRLVRAIGHRPLGGTADRLREDPPQQTNGPSLLQLESPVAAGIVLVQDYERLSLCASLSDSLPPAMLDLLGLGSAELADEVPLPGRSHQLPRDYRHVLRSAGAAMDRMQMAYHWVDSNVPAASLKRYRLLVVPAFIFLEQALVERLTRWVELGGILIFCPQVPALDEACEPLSIPLPQHQVAEMGDVPRILSEAVGGQGWEPGVRVTADFVDIALFGDGTSVDPDVLFLANRSAEVQRGTVEGLPDRRLVRDALDGQPFDLQALCLQPYEIRMLRLGPVESP